MAFTVADGLWVVASAVALLLFWTQMTPLARVLVIGVAVVVDAFAMLQFRAAGGFRSQPA
jgi:type IV secretory pathway TrbL component